MTGKSEEREGRGVLREMQTCGEDLEKKKEGIEEKQRLLLLLFHNVIISLPCAYIFITSPLRSV